MVDGFKDSLDFIFRLPTWQDLFRLCFGVYIVFTDRDQKPHLTRAGFPGIAQARPQNSEAPMDCCEKLTPEFTCEPEVFRRQ